MSDLSIGLNSKMKQVYRKNESDPMLVNDKIPLVNVIITKSDCPHFLLFRASLPKKVFPDLSFHPLSVWGFNTSLVLPKIRRRRTRQKKKVKVISNDEAG